MKVFLLSIALFAISLSCNTSKKGEVIIPDDLRAKEISDMKFGMFICWSFSTFYGAEWTPTLDKDASFFKATGCDTDQWCRVAKDAGMGYILFLSKHHDGFCLWDTKTTDKKVTNSPIGIDVLAKLRKSCDKYGIKLALYFSEGDWNWPGAVDGKSYREGVSINPEMKKAQLKELCTQYGPIEFYWMDHAVGDGGLNHKETAEWVHQFQPNCFVGFNHGEPAGRLSLREMGKPGPIGDASATKYNKDAEANYKGYLAAEFTYPILPPHEGGAMWFYSLPEHDSLCHPASKIYQDYRGAVKYGNIFSVDVGPNYEGRIRDIDVETLKEVGNLIQEHNLPDPLKGKAPVKVIFETDMTTDVDDVGALATLHALADQNEVELLAVCYNEVNKDAPAAIDAINTWYHRGDIPIGIYKKPLASPDTSGYLRFTARFPNDIPENLDLVPDALDVYVETLKSQPDGSVTIVSVGFLNNLADLLDSELELIEQKVKELVIMGGLNGDAWNLVRHGLVETSDKVFRDWPTPIVISQPGVDIHTGEILEHTSAQNPVRESYYRYFHGSFKGRSSWDQLAILYGVRGLRYFSLQSEGAGKLDNGTSIPMKPDWRSYITEELSNEEYEHIVNQLMAKPPEGNN